MVNSKANNQATTAIDRAVAAIILREPWYASLLLRLSRRAHGSIPTMMTNGKELIYNPDWIVSLSESELLGVLLHETLHCILLHITRRGNRNLLGWNIACDRVVNAAVLSSGYMLPEGCIPPAFLSRVAEEEYEDVMQQVSLKIGTPGQDLPETSDMSIPILEQEWKQAVAIAPECIPAALQRYVKELLTPTYSWREILASWLSQHRPIAEHTWTRQNRRLPNLPGRKSLPTGMFAIVLDTSGSISSEHLNQFHSELKSILQSLPECRVYCMSADAVIHDIIEPGESLPKVWSGGGGTDFRPALAWAEEHQMDAVVYFTDGAGTFPNVCSVPVCWVISRPNPPSPSFGIVIPLRA